MKATNFKTLLVISILIFLTHPLCLSTTKSNLKKDSKRSTSSAIPPKKFPVSSLGKEWTASIKSSEETYGDYIDFTVHKSKNKPLKLIHDDDTATVRDISIVQLNSEPEGETNEILAVIWLHGQTHSLYLYDPKLILQSPPTKGKIKEKGKRTGIYKFYSEGVIGYNLNPGRKGITISYAKSVGSKNNLEQLKIFEIIWPSK